MDAAKAGTRATLFHKVMFGAMMAALGIGLQAGFARAWPAVLDACNGSEAFAVVLTCGIVPALVYWAHSLLIGWRTDWNRLDDHRKVQPGRGPSADDYFRGAPLVLFNTFIVGPGLTFLALPLWEMSWKAWGIDSPDKHIAAIPTALTFLGSMVVFLLVEEVGFYYGHRIAHHPSIYGAIHKRHHEYFSPVAYSAVYAHPLEHIVVNVAPVVAGPVLMASHPATAAAWIVLALIYTTNSHCGYFLTPYGSPEGHDWHHAHPDENFGVLGLLDSVHGTDTKFVQEMARRDTAAMAVE